LDASLTAAEKLLRERGRLYKILADSHDLIPALLQAKVNAAAASAASEVFTSYDKDRVTSHLAAIEAELAATVRQRNGARDGLMAMEPALSAALAKVEDARTTYATGVIADFSRRYAVAVAAMQELWHEADALSKSLRLPVDAAPPVRLIGGTTACFVAIETARLEKVLPESAAPIAVDPLTTRIGIILDGLNEAVNYSKGLAATLTREKFLKPFRDAVDNLPYQPGVLLDASLLGPTSLQRAASVKLIVLELAGQSSTQAQVA
jgi:hypothetical protein